MGVAHQHTCRFFTNLCWIVFFLYIQFCHSFYCMRTHVLLVQNRRVIHSKWQLRRTACSNKNNLILQLRLYARVPISSGVSHHLKTLNYLFSLFTNRLTPCSTQHKPHYKDLRYFYSIEKNCLDFFIRQVRSHSLIQGDSYRV